MKFKVVEKFVSVNGEGLRSGQLAVFIRFAGCNLKCSYCDTKWANKKDVFYEEMTSQEIYDYIKGTNIINVTLTGGEPLYQEGVEELLCLLSKDKELKIEIETNGSIALDRFLGMKNRPSFTMDYKLPSSNMEDEMIINNFRYLTKDDTLKFVVGNNEDLEKVKLILYKSELIDKTNIYVSPVWKMIKMEHIVEFMKINNLNGVTLQMQLHKVIWNPRKRGV